MPTTPYPLPDPDEVMQLCKAMATVNSFARTKVASVIAGVADIRYSLPAIRQAATEVAFTEDPAPSMALRQKCRKFLRDYGGLTRGGEAEARKRIGFSMPMSQWEKIAKAAEQVNMTYFEFMIVTSLSKADEVLE